MKFDVPRKLSSKAFWVDSGAGSSQASRTKSLRGKSGSSIGRLTGLGISTSSTTISSSRHKRKREERFADGGGAIKRSRSGDSGTSLANVHVEHEPDTTDVHSIQEAEPDSLVGCESETYGNRIHCCLVVSPAGQPLYVYRSVRELLEALRDSIRGHKSLLEDGRILHRDISKNNIIITEAATDRDPKGMLIDLDLAKELDSVPSRASHRTGTMQFMAIEVLQGKGHTYRHDLESFFYVLIWMCIRHGYDYMDNGQASKKGLLATSRLRR
jgi:Fungal protein kinase